MHTTTGGWLCILTIVSASATTAADVSVSMTPAWQRVSPGLAAVVSIAVTNEGEKEVQIPDFRWEPFFGAWQWKWEWQNGERSHPIRVADVAYAIPSPLPPKLVKLRPRESLEYVAVVPVPRVLVDEEKGRLEVTLTVPMQQISSKATCEFQLREETPVAVVKGLDSKFVQVAISTSMSGAADEALKLAKAEDSARKLAASDNSMLLALFCIAAGRGKFDEQSWLSINQCTGDYRAIRDANLYQALATGNIRLTAQQGKRNMAQIDGAYPFSKAMVSEVAKRIVK